MCVGCATCVGMVSASRAQPAQIAHARAGAPPAGSSLPFGDWPRGVAGAAHPPPKNLLGYYTSSRSMISIRYWSGSRTKQMREPPSRTV
jgi:hypothetical protein